MRAPASPQVASGPQQRRSYGGVPSFQGQATSKFPSAPNTPRHSQGDLTDSRPSSPVANSRRRLSGLRAPSLATPPKPAPSKLGGPRVADQGPRPAAPGLQSPRVTAAAAPGRRGGGGAAGPPLVALTVNVKMLDSNYWLLNICVIFSVELKFDGTFNFTFDCLRIAPLRVPNKTSCVILLHHGM